MKSVIKIQRDDDSTTENQRSRPGLICIESSNNPAVNKQPLIHVFQHKCQLDPRRPLGPACAEDTLLRGQV